MGLGPSKLLVGVSIFGESSLKEISNLFAFLNMGLGVSFILNVPVVGETDDFTFLAIVVGETSSQSPRLEGSGEGLKFDNLVDMFTIAFRHALNEEILDEDDALLEELASK
ncbi:hypothetical protein OPV22_002992 [Ensete ventricosum]|uniref:Uncharacterized protein n=1 Tax=Ensete ventricosum TaxID=4639 RepID=A0AAV8RZL4_ENSVE|nr:hypothetical protein OPV22_002992 [Ensete ventricosum]